MLPPPTIKITPGKRQRLRVGDPDFRPPDGGWGWLIVFACGFSNLSTFPMFQQFGLIFRSKFEELGISQTETTTIFNLNSAFNAGMGLLNGPLFRRFTYRQVAMFGSCLVFSSLFLTQLFTNFWTYIIFYSILYGSGIGITQSSNALALNTYFRDKRRIATGLSWSTTALGPIVWPYIITALLPYYETQGTLLIFSAFAMHAFMCSLLLQPVEWHTNYREIEPQKEPPTLAKSTSKSRSLFSSQYLQNEESGYEIMDLGTPMMLRANDGWYSQQSLSGPNSLLPSKRSSYNNLNEARSKRNSSANLAGLETKERKRKSSVHKIRIEEEEEGETNRLVVPEVLPTEVLENAARKLEIYKETELEEEPQLSLCQKIAIFFDFDLFKDTTYVNLMLGITIANFAELNFSILTPMVLHEFNFEKYQIATFMSVLGVADILIRFVVPFLADQIKWSNKTFFLVGVLSMALGRVILVHTQTYNVSLFVAGLIGAGKGLRTIFMALIIPGYVPLERLPAASGLQLATSGLLFIFLGPIVGWVRELVHNYVITLHLLNICTYTTAIAWTLEGIISKRRKNNTSTKPIK